MGLSITNKALNKYFGFLLKLDNQSKKKLINKLSASLKPNENNNKDLSLFGAWQDERSSDTIIEEIRKSRIDKTDLDSF